MKADGSAVGQFRFHPLLATLYPLPFFESQPPGYRRICLHWVVSAKRAETRERRLNTVIADSAAGRRIGALWKTSDS